MISVKRLDDNMPPPRSRFLFQKIRFITRRWLAATEQKPPPEIPESNVWQLDNNGYKILWFEGTATPKKAPVIDSAEDEGCLKIYLNCSHRFLSLFFFVLFCFRLVLLYLFSY